MKLNHQSEKYSENIDQSICNNNNNKTVIIIKQQNNNNETVTSPLDIANAFNHNFSKVALNVQSSIKSLQSNFMNSSLH